MKKYKFYVLPVLVILAVAITMLFAASGSQQFSYKWTTVLGAPTGELEVKAMRVDRSGNVYAVGNFTSTFAGVTSQGGSDIFVRKYSSTGSVLWTKIIGGLYNDIAYALAVNSTGEVLIAGLFGGAVDFDPSSSTDTKQGIPMYNGFLLKLTTDGNYIWSKVIKQAIISAVAFDANDTIFYAGAFQSATAKTGTSPHGILNAINLNPVGGQDNKVSKNLFPRGYSWQTSGGAEINNAYGPKPDLFFSKLSPDGTTYYWTQTYGATNQGFAPTAMAINGTDVYITGLQGGDSKVNGQYFNTFLVKYATDYTTTPTWMTVINGIAPTDMIVGSGSVYLCGLTTTGISSSSLRFYGYINFPQTISSLSVSSAQGFIKKLDSGGNVQWTYQTKKLDPLAILSLGLDPAGNVYATGSFQGLADFENDLARQDYKYSQGGTKDGFLLKLNPNGAYAWVQTFGAYGDDIGERLVISDNSLFVAGLFSGGFNFDFTGGSDYLSSVSRQSEFLTKLTFYNPTTGFIKGIVSSTAGTTAMRIGNATVSLVGTAYSTTTASDGTFTLLDVPPGNYTMMVSAGNFDAATVPVTVTAGASAAPNVALTFLCSVANSGIRGQVMSTAGNANLLIGNATVTLLDSNGNPVFTTKSDANGYFYFGNVAAGTYTVRIAADNFETMNRQVSVTPGTTLDMATSQTQLGVQCATGPLGGDASGDGRIGLEDVIYDLQIISDQRTAKTVP